MKLRVDFLSERHSWLKAVHLSSFHGRPNELFLVPASDPLLVNRGCGICVVKCSSASLNKAFPSLFSYI